MADPQLQTEPAIGSEEYFRRMHPTSQHGSAVPPAIQDTVAAAKSTATPTDVYRQPVPPGQWEAGLGRELGIAANQFGIGMLGIPATALHYGWQGLHSLDPAGFNEPPAWTNAEGPGSYGEALTYGPLTPSGPGERILARGARATGTAATGMLAGMGPVAAGVNALGGFAGGAATEAGYPGVGAGIELASGLPGLATVARRMPFTGPPSSMWTSISGGPPLPSPAMLEAHRMAQLVRMEMWAPLTHRLPLGTGVALNYALTRGMNNPSTAGATTAASRILGFGIGAGVGISSATENYPPAMSYSAPPSFAPPNNHPNNQ